MEAFEEHEVAVTFLVEDFIGAKAEGIVMPDEAIGGIERLPAGEPSAPGEVGVFHVHEEGMVEAAEVEEEVAADSEGGAGDSADGEGGIEGGGGLVEAAAEGDTGAMDIIPGGIYLGWVLLDEDFGGGEADIVIGLEGGDERLEPVWLGDSVGVEEDEDIAGGVVGAEIIGATEAEVVVTVEEGDLGPALGDGGGAIIGGGVIDDDDFGMGGGSGDGLEAGMDIVSAIVVNDDEGGGNGR